MLIDLHIHTNRYSSCSVLEPRELVDEARRIGLDGFCLTEHNTLWDPKEVKALAQGQGLTILRGNEITTTQGDALVFGLEEEIKEVTTVQELRRKVDRAGSILIAAHPFRGFLMFGFSELHLSVEEAARREVFQYVDGLEICNSRVTDHENDLARQVAERLCLPGVGGSDAHASHEVGICVTEFLRPISNETDLIAELKARRFKVRRFRENQSR
jgi:predicted metal-dependent phosphoesterase TrpH